MSAPARTRLNLAEAPSFEALSTCVHCGLCLESCPTYRELRIEMDSPRGRIYLMKGILDGRLEPGPEVLRHLDRCLDCRACETACPSGVKYGELIEKTRTALQPIRRSSPFVRVLRWIGFSRVLPSRAWQRVLFALLAMARRLGLLRLGAALAREGLLPPRLAAAALQAPDAPPRSFRDDHRERQDAHGTLRFTARGERRHRVALFTGCLADRLFAQVNEAAVEVLVENGCDVDVLAGETCCGALHIHNGARDQARALAAANVRAFAAGAYDAVISTAAGCGAELRHYGNLLPGDPDAARFGAAVRDVSEFLHQIGCRAPRVAGSRRGRLAYDDPCHLLHAQKIGAAPRALLRAVPGLDLVPLTNADACCGSAGLYSMLEPELAAAVGHRKIDAIRESGADVVATGNPGCLLQIRAGLRAAGLAVDVVHPVEILADAYRAERRVGPGA